MPFARFLISSLCFVDASIIASHVLPGGQVLLLQFKIAHVHLTTPFFLVAGNGLDASAESAPTVVPEPKHVLAENEGVDLSTVEESWLNFVDRQISKFVALVVEKGLSQSQLSKELEKYTLAKLDGTSAGNVVIMFDSNLFGEAITAPHIRQCPMQQSVITKLWKAVQAVRATEAPGIIKPGDVLILLDGGKKNSNHLLSCFGVAKKDRAQIDKGRKPKDGKTICREVTIFLSEESVQARKWRKKTKNDTLNCCQVAHVFHNGVTAINARDHKHFPKTSNLSNALGPVSLQPFANLPKMTVGQKKEFWGARRRAVGGKTNDSEGEDDEEDELEEEIEDEELEIDGMQVSSVGAGRGSKGVPDNAIQPIAFHALPRIVGDSLLHAFWGMSVIDLTPGSGELCMDAVLNNTGYIGICQTQCQKDFILLRLKKEILASMAQSDSKMRPGD